MPGLQQRYYLQARSSYALPEIVLADRIAVGAVYRNWLNSANLAAFINDWLKSSNF